MKKFNDSDNLYVIDLTSMRILESASSLGIRNRARQFETYKDDADFYNGGIHLTATSIGIRFTLGCINHLLETDGVEYIIIGDCIKLEKCGNIVTPVIIHKTLKTGNDWLNFYANGKEVS